MRDEVLRCLITSPLHNTPSNPTESSSNPLVIPSAQDTMVFASGACNYGQTTLQEHDDIETPLEHRERERERERERRGGRGGDGRRGGRGRETGGGEKGGSI